MSKDDFEKRARDAAEEDCESLIHKLKSSEHQPRKDGFVSGARWLCVEMLNLLNQSEAPNLESGILSALIIARREGNAEREAYAAERVREVIEMMGKVDIMRAFHPFDTRDVAEWLKARLEARLKDEAGKGKQDG